MDPSALQLYSDLGREGSQSVASVLVGAPDDAHQLLAAWRASDTRRYFESPGAQAFGLAPVASSRFGWEWLRLGLFGF